MVSLKRFALLSLAMFAAPAMVSAQTVSSSSMSSSSGVSSSSMSSMSASSTTGASASSMSSVSASGSSSADSVSGSSTGAGGAGGAVSSSSGSGAAPTFCQKYANLAFAGDQKALITAVVTRAVLGNATVTPAVQGIVGAGSPIVQYFNGSVAYYRSGVGATPVGGRNFLTTTTLFNTLAAHLVAWFGRDLGCDQAQTGTVASGITTANMSFVHELMYVNNASMTYFDTQLANTLTSLGVTTADVGVAASYLASFQRGSRQDLVICSAADCSTAQSLNAVTLTPALTSGSSSSGGVGSSGTSTGGSGSTGTSAAQNLVPAASAFVAIALSAAAMLF